MRCIILYLHHMHFKKLLMEVFVDDILFVSRWRIWFLCFFSSPFFSFFLFYLELKLCVYVWPCSICDFAMCSGCCCSVGCSAWYVGDAVAPVLFFSPDLSKLIMARQSGSPLCWSSGCVTLTLLCFFFLFFSFFLIISPWFSTHSFREMLRFPVSVSI